MSSKYVKSVLVFNRAQNKAPNFILVYLLISLVWHHQFFITFFVSQGSFSEKLTTALSENTHHYITVFVCTILFFILRLIALYVLNKTDGFIEEDESIEDKIGNDNAFKDDNDVVRLLALLEETKAQLSKVKEREALANTEKKTAIGQALSIQAELDLALADITILGKSNDDLKAKLNECKVV